MTPDRLLDAACEFLAAHPRYACAFFVGLCLTAGWLDRVLP